jgi:carbon-monoxide dehydrogenase small subunit
MTSQDAKQQVRLTVNSRTHDLLVEPNAVLLHTLREIGYTDVKNGCEIGECGTCAVLLNGTAVNSCMVLTVQADGAEIVTNAGLGTIDRPHPIQEAFADAGAIQCGFCTPGMVISTKALLDRNPDPSESEIREALSGNLCRCTGYGQIVAAVQLAAERLRGLPSWASSSLRDEGREDDLGDRLLASESSSLREAGRESSQGMRIPVVDEPAKGGDRA